MKLMRTMAEDVPLQRWAKAHGCHRYVGSSVKGEAAIGWSDQRARRRLPAGITTDADQILELARQTQRELLADSARQQTIADGAKLLGQLLLQDVERVGGGDSDAADTEGEVSLADGVSKTGPCRCMTGRWTAATRAASDALTGTRLRWWWTPAPS